MFKTGSRGGLLVFTLCLLFSASAFAQNWGNPVWSDEFTGPLGTPIDSTKWTYDTGILNVNNEVEYYCAPSTVTGGCLTTNPNAYIDGNGHLVIQAIRQNNSTTPYSGSWTSARLNTNGLESFQYGRVESSMSLPVGPGIWPAFWALGTNISGPNAVGWPSCGEQDYMENVPLSPGGLGPNVIASTLHGNSTNGAYGLGGRYTLANNSDVTGMHAYGAIWSPGMVQFYVDDPTQVFFVGTASDMKSGQTWAFEHPFFLLLNLAIGGDGSWPGPPDATTPSPALMTVDYVRIYKAATVQTPTFGAPPAIAVKAGATTGNSSTFSIADAAGSGRVYLTCSTNAPQATCQVSTSDPLDAYTVDFTNATSVTVNVSVQTTANAGLLSPSWRWQMPNGQRILALILFAAILAGVLYSSRRLRWASTAGVGFFLLLILLLGCSGGGSTTVPPVSGGTTPGSYTVTINAYTVSGNGTNPDATASIPLTVN
jgi:beta-glucanase (GH16 family)